MLEERMDPEPVTAAHIQAKGLTSGAFFPFTRWVVNTASPNSWSSSSGLPKECSTLDTIRRAKKPCTATLPMRFYCGLY
ncbi:hypothetical protein EVAR_38055_1 [Eumeta japonica]|uniref:Uncharacterized protein n=1 Tax=Eumeta variegata TaxID=151549 RepID=A0A4C1W8A3_EUMVA|nr:hypothetical protein EVAR_38055_1 [Eumeta japonica]